VYSVHTLVGCNSSKVVQDAAQFADASINVLDIFEQAATHTSRVEFYIVVSSQSKAECTGLTLCHLQLFNFQLLFSKW